MSRTGNYYCPLCERLIQTEDTYFYRHLETCGLPVEDNSAESAHQAKVSEILRKRGFNLKSLENTK
jgi:hypothetical protein